MLVLDVNVLLALFRADHPQHEVVAQWWAAASASGTTVTAPDVVWSAVVRLATNARVFDVPSGLAATFEFVRAMHDQPTYLASGHVPGVLEELERVCLASSASAALVPDAYIAAYAGRLGAGVVTFDRDFRRFDGLRLVELG